jgi:hypothetical protein
MVGGEALGWWRDDGFIMAPGPDFCLDLSQIPQKPE